MTYRIAALRNAAQNVGVMEHPPNSNRGTKIDRWNLDACDAVGVYWCASFVHGMYKLAGYFLSGGASVGAIRAWAKGHGYLVERPRRGDLVCFEFGQDGGYDDHIGIVERVLALRWQGNKFTGWIQTIEGNTSSGDSGSQSNGGGVFRRRRWVKGISAEFIRIPGGNL